MSTFFAERGRLFMADGPWNVALTERHADRLLQIFDEASAVTLFNALWLACETAGYQPSTFGRREVIKLVERAA